MQPFGCGYKANRVGIIADVPLSESYTSGCVSSNSMFEDANLGYYVAASKALRSLCNKLASPRPLQGNSRRSIEGPAQPV